MYNLTWYLQLIDVYIDKHESSTYQLLANMTSIFKLFLTNNCDKVPFSFVVHELKQ